MLNYASCEVIIVRKLELILYHGGIENTMFSAPNRCISIVLVYELPG